MGCDIHCYIEYRRKATDSWSDFGGKINPGRSYNTFARLAGVRNYDGITPVAEPKGFPDDAAYASSVDNWVFITDEPDGGCCTPGQAARWVGSGSRYSEDKRRVSHPDWHSHSWVTPDEFASSLGEFSGLEYKAVLAAMRSFEAEGCEARLVFWFDN